MAFKTNISRLYKSSGMGQVYGPRCHLGDHMGCGIKFPAGANPKQAGQAYVFFTRNGKEVNIIYIKKWQQSFTSDLSLVSKDKIRDCCTIHIWLNKER